MTETTPAAGPMRPGLYLRKRRFAAGLTIAQVAVKIASADDHDPQALEEAIRRIETEELASVAAAWHSSLLDQLHSAFAFDKGVYLSLVSALERPGRPLLPICRECGCTAYDPCLEGEGADARPCGWASSGDEEPLCTSCAAADLDLSQMGSVIAVAEVAGDDCPDCGGELGPVFGATKSRTCGNCDTTFLGAGEEVDRHAA